MSVRKLPNRYEGPIGDKPIRAVFPRDGDSDTFVPENTKVSIDTQYEGKFIVNSLTRKLSLWEQQVDQLSFLLHGKKGACKIFWKKIEGTSRVEPTFPE